MAALIVEVDALAREDGMDGRDASRVALRACKLCVMLLAGVEQKAAARELGVSERTAKLDAQRLRRAWPRVYYRW